MNGEPADPPRFRIGAQVTRRASRSAEESREGTALFWWGLGDTPQPQSARSLRPAGESREGAALFGGGFGGTPQPLSAPLPARDADGPPVGNGRTPTTPLRPAGESREGAALFGGGLGVPPNPYPLRFPPGKWEDLRRGTGAPRPPLSVRRESPERAQPSLVGVWGFPQPLSAPFPAREAGGPPEGNGRDNTNSLPCQL